MQSDYLPEEEIDPLGQIKRSHSTRTHKNGLDILLNIPEDFIYDTGPITLRYNTSDSSYKIFCKKMPDTITDKMSSYQGCLLRDLVPFLENNLELFCSNKDITAVPESYSKPSMKSYGEHATKSYGDHEMRPTNRLTNGTNSIVSLPENYAFPLHNNATPNFALESSKTGILICICTNPNITVSCFRCKNSFEIHANSSKPTGANCSACASSVEVLYIPLASQEFLGFLSLKNCDFVCFNPSKFQITCENCQAAYETYPLSVADRCNTKCFSCYSSIQLCIERVGYIYRKNYSLKAGNELPSKGTCKHYKKSQRWFRFPCCQSLYPCDVCHDEESGHKHEMAVRMVCGLCSKEQSIKPDCGCGMSLKKKSTSFWEGGKGNRDKAKMSRRDSKKHTK